MADAYCRKLSHTCHDGLFCRGASFSGVEEWVRNRAGPFPTAGFTDFLWWFARQSQQHNLGPGVGGGNRSLLRAAPAPVDRARWIGGIVSIRLCLCLL